MGSCCSSSNRAVAVGVEDDINHTSKNDHHKKENTGFSNGYANNTTSTKENTSTNRNHNFILTPKYTLGVNSAVAAQTHSRSASTDVKSSSAVFPSSSGYKNNDSFQQTSSFLSPNQVDDNTLLTTFSNADHLRASPYLSSINNRKHNNKSLSEGNRFTGFDAPVTNTDSENDFDSDIEKDSKNAQKTEVRSPSNISLSSLLEEEKDNTPNTG